MAAEDQRQVEEGEAKAPPQINRADLRAQVKESTLTWVKDTVSGIATAVAVVLFGLVLVQLGLAQEGQELEFSLFSPYEFWQSFSGLVVSWSQWNEWLLLSLGAVALLVTSLVFLWWRRAQPQEEVEQPGQPKSPLHRAGNTLRSMKTVGAFGMLTGLFFGAYAYQQYLWNVELPVPEDQIGIAFTRQVGSTVARDRLADYLRQMGHEGQIVMRDLPVTLDARNTAQAQEFARRIGADAVIIYREENADAVDPILLSRGSGMAAPARQEGGAGKRYVAYIAFADPSLGVQIPVPQRSAQGSVESVAYRTKEGVEVPRLEATDVGRLMEAAAGILLYDQDRYLPAIAHLKNSLSSGGGAEGTEGSDGLLRFYLGNAYYLINQVSDATKAFDESIALLERQEQLGVQDRLLLAQVYSYRAEYYAFGDGKLDEGEEMLRKAIALRESLDKDETALKDPVTFRRMHDIFGTAYVRLMQIARVREDEDAAALWTGRAKEEAKALMGRLDDNRAQVRAIWITFLAGECEQAYKMAYEILQEKPDDLYARRLLWRIATLRDNDVTSPETKRHIDALLRINPRSLPDLHTLSL
ncbi:MAG: hypothetical protein ABIO92_05090, partial [Chloroflexia bacterium]